MVAITSDVQLDERIRILSNGFDSIIDIRLMDHKDLKQLLLNMLDKGRARLGHRVQHEEYQRFLAALSASPDAFIILDPQKQVFFVSDHYRRAYPMNGHLLQRGVSILEHYDALAAEQGILPGDPRYTALRNFWEQCDGQTEITFDNNRTWRIKAAPLEGAQGTIVTTTDITDYSRQHDMLAEKSGALEKALEMEKEAAAIQKQFINMVSHEFRTPLSIIDGNAQILLRRFETLTPELIRQRLTTIRSAVSRLVGMMEGVLSSNMLRTGRIDIQPQSFDLRMMMTEMCREYADLSSLHVIDCRTDKLAERVVLDKKALTLILSNLVGNAVKFTRDKPHIIVEGASLPDGGVLLRVSDNGVGIPENEIEKVFERYYRATTAGSIPGTGIGLNLVSELVELHGGKIEIQSGMGQGTDIAITFPSCNEYQSTEGEAAYAESAQA
jgi:signal transduction histidine kinase